MRSQPLIIGHRGASAVAPENTIAAFTRALRDGADGIVFDVRLASDRVPVVIHDATLQRTALIDGAVSDFPSSQLRKTDVGSWFNETHPDVAAKEYARETVPTLEQVFEVFSATSAWFYLEMKCDGHESNLLAREVVRLIRKYSLGDRVAVESFDLSSLETVRLIDSHVRTAALFEPRLNRPVSLLRKMKMVDLALRCGADEIALHHSLASGRVARRARDHGLNIVVWTVDDPKWIERARSLGLKAVITNDPRRMSRAIRTE